MRGSGTEADRVIVHGGLPLRVPNDALSSDEADRVGGLLDMDNPTLLDSLNDIRKTVFVALSCTAVLLRCSEAVGEQTRENEARVASGDAEVLGVREFVTVVPARLAVRLSTSVAVGNGLRE